MKRLEYHVYMELLSLKDRCWNKDSSLKIENVRKLEERVNHYKLREYDTGIFENILLNFQYIYERETKKTGEEIRKPS
ncbi:MAG: hypothetical protein AABY22_09670 [Nanoarchaeota archaeon]